MASKFYEKIVANYRGFEQPGIVVYVVENDGGVGLEMAAADKRSDSNDGPFAFFNVEEAGELVSAIEERFVARNRKKRRIRGARKTLSDGESPPLGRSRTRGIKRCQEISQSGGDVMARLGL